MKKRSNLEENDASVPFCSSEKLPSLVELWQGSLYRRLQLPVAVCLLEASRLCRHSSIASASSAGLKGVIGDGREDTGSPRRSCPPSIKLGDE